MTTGIESLDAETLRKSYLKMIEEDLANKGLYLSSEGEWVERRQSFFYSRFRKIKQKMSKFCCYPFVCVTTLSLALMVGILASFAAWLSLPILLGYLVFVVLTPEASA